MRYILSTIALTALASSYVTALGINCKGSDSCRTFVAKNHGDRSNVAEALKNAIDTIADDKKFKSGDHIFCIQGLVGHICAFLQKVGSDGLLAKEIKVLAGNIVDHNCRGCGSAPVFGDDIENQGELTFNYIRPH